MKSSFELGLVVATAGAALALAKSRTNPEDYLRRHSAGDFGDVGDAEGQANLKAIEAGGRVRSIYTLASGDRLHVITDIGSTTSIVCAGEE